VTSGCGLPLPQGRVNAVHVAIQKGIFAVFSRRNGLPPSRYCEMEKARNGGIPGFSEGREAWSGLYAYALE